MIKLLLVAAAVAWCLLTSHAVVTEQPPAPKMVQPESLDQGFILVVDDQSRIANAASPIHLASSHNGWNPADAQRILSARSDNRWQIVLPKPDLDSKMAFKFTRGSWDSVECAADFKDIDNRLLPLIDASKLAPGEKPVIELVIPAWKDHGPRDPAAAGGAINPYREIKVGAGRIARVEVVGGGIPVVRDLLVWLPPGYDDAANSERRYPVLYLNDGQNVFEKLPRVPGEWQADETAGRLIAEGKIEPLIIVGIPHSGEGRMQEYVPDDLFDGVPARGREYIDFVLHEVMPRVERTFRVRSGPDSTAIGGASLGGMISLEAATEHPDVFGKVLAESTPLLSKERKMFRRFAAKTNWPHQVYFGMGGREGQAMGGPAMNSNYADSAEAFRELLHGRGLTEENGRLRVVVAPSDEHDEIAWSRRLGPALEFLFPPRAE